MLSSSSSRARAGGAPRARARPEFQLEDAKRGVPGRRVRVWARCARWKGRHWGRRGEGVTGSHRNALFGAFGVDATFRSEKTDSRFGPANLGETAHSFG